MDKKQVGAWALFDFANSAYPAVMTTAVFPIYFAVTVVGGERGRGDYIFGIAVSMSALIVAASAPLLGAIADKAGVRKKFMLLYTATCLLGLVLLTTVHEGMVLRGFALFVMMNVGFEGALVFYNAYLPDIVPPDMQGRVSGLGYGVGYLGSAVGLGMAIPFARTQPEIVWLLVAGFFLLFSLPAFLFLPPDQKTEMGVGDAASWGITHFKTIVQEVLREPELKKFLLAFFFYIDGVLTIIVVAGLVAKETFGFSDDAVIVLFLIVQGSALAGALAFAKPTDLWGPKRILDGVLVVWVVAAIAAFFLRNPDHFYVLAVIAGLGLGSVQAASRAFMASLIPDGKEAEMFGFYALCGKSSSVMGPQLFGLSSLIFAGNQRPGFLLLGGLFLIGLLLLQRVKDPKASPA